MKSKAGESYFLDKDDDGHWYVVPLCKSEEWDKWQDIDSDDEAKWKVPEFAIPIGGHPNRIAFKDWTFDLRFTL